MRNKTLPDLLFSQAEKQPDAIAIVDGETQLTYKDLANQVRQLAGGLDIASGERFSIWAPNCAEWIVACLAGQMRGAIMVPLNTRYKGVEAGDILRRSGSVCLFTVEGFLGHDYPAILNGEDLPDLRAVHLLRDANGERLSGLMGQPLNRVSAAPNAPSDILFTSGTTGAPKGAVTHHAQNIDVFTAFVEAIGMKASDRYLVVNPFFHSFGYKAGWLSCLIAGATIYPFPVWNPVAAMQRIAQARITVMPGAPTIFQTILSDPEFGQHDISSLRIATTGATTIPVDLIRAMHEDIGIDHVYSAYGLTESCGVVSLCRDGDDFETIATTCGRALPGTELRMVDPDTGEDAQEGEVWVRGFNVMQGYLDAPEATAEAITPDGWLRTGDIGTLDGRGYLRITDRLKDMIIVGGFNCYPAEVEKILGQHPDISEVAVVGVDDERLGQVPHAHIVGSVDPEGLRDWCRERMANFKVPRVFTIHDGLPRNASGKVQKFKLH